MNLTILSTATHEPVLVLNEDERGLAVVDGDPKWVQTLRLDQFNSLQEIAGYINEPESGFQAILSGETEPGSDPQQEPTSETQTNLIDMERLAPALEIIKQLLARVEERRDRENDQDQSNTAEGRAATTTGAEVVLPMNEPLYVSLDGDNIGNAVARAESADDEKELAEISGRINAGQSVLKQWAEAHGGTVIEQGGDEGLVRVPSISTPDIEELRRQYAATVGATASVGVGRKISESTKARMLAKLRGKNQTVMFDESTDRELSLLLRDADTSESTKIQSAMNPGAIPEQRPNPERGEGKDVPKTDLDPDGQSSISTPQSPAGEEESQNRGTASMPENQDADEVTSVADEPQSPEDGSEAVDIPVETVMEAGSPNWDRGEEENSGRQGDPAHRALRRRHHEAALKTASQEGADPNFLRSASVALMKGDGHG